MTKDPRLKTNRRSYIINGSLLDLRRVVKKSTKARQNKDGSVEKDSLKDYRRIYTKKFYLNGLV